MLNKIWISAFVVAFYSATPCFARGAQQANKNGPAAAPAAAAPQSIVYYDAQGKRQELPWKWVDNASVAELQAVIPQVMATASLIEKASDRPTAAGWAETTASRLYYFESLLFAEKRDIPNDITQATLGDLATQAGAVTSRNNVIDSKFNILDGADYDLTLFANPDLAKPNL